MHRSAFDRSTSSTASAQWRTSTASSLYAFREKPVDKALIALIHTFVTRNSADTLEKIKALMSQHSKHIFDQNKRNILDALLFQPNAKQALRLFQVTLESLDQPLLAFLYRGGLMNPLIIKHAADPFVFPLIEAYGNFLYQLNSKKEDLFPNQRLENRLVNNQIISSIQTLPNNQALLAWLTAMLQKLYTEGKMFKSHFDYYSNRIEGKHNEHVPLQMQSESEKFLNPTHQEPEHRDLPPTESKRESKEEARSSKSIPLTAKPVLFEPIPYSRTIVPSSIFSSAFWNVFDQAQTIHKASQTTAPAPEGNTPTFS